MTVHKLGKDDSSVVNLRRKLRTILSKRMAKLDVTPFLGTSEKSALRAVHRGHRTNRRKRKGYRELVGSTLNSTYSKDNQEP